MVSRPIGCQHLGNVRAGAGRLLICWPNDPNLHRRSGSRELSRPDRTESGDIPACNPEPNAGRSWENSSLIRTDPRGFPQGRDDGITLISAESRGQKNFSKSLGSFCLPRLIAQRQSPTAKRQPPIAPACICWWKLLQSFWIKIDFAGAAFAWPRSEERSESNRPERVRRTGSPRTQGS